MDGINGITVLYALTAIISFALLPYIKIVYLLITMGLSCVVFEYLMSEKAKHLLEMKVQYGGFLRLLYDKDNSRLWTIGIYSFSFCLWN
jgi:hypothetical protein